MNNPPQMYNDLRRRRPILCPHAAGSSKEDRRNENNVRCCECVDCTVPDMMVMIDSKRRDGYTADKVSE
jgi:hypothetical protein